LSCRSRNKENSDQWDDGFWQCRPYGSQHRTDDPLRKVELTSNPFHAVRKEAATDKDYSQTCDEEYWIYSRVPLENTSTLDLPFRVSCSLRRQNGRTQPSLARSFLVQILT
jgi:hypothetical protein